MVVLCQILSLPTIFQLLPVLTPFSRMWYGFLVVQMSKKQEIYVSISPRPRSWNGHEQSRRQRRSQQTAKRTFFLKKNKEPAKRRIDAPALSLSAKRAKSVYVNEMTVEERRATMLRQDQRCRIFPLGWKIKRENPSHYTVHRISTSLAAAPTYPFFNEPGREPHSHCPPIKQTPHSPPFLRSADVFLPYIQYVTNAVPVPVVCITNQPALNPD